MWNYYWRGSPTHGKNNAKQKKKLCYKGIIVVILGIDFLEVEIVARLLQESTV